jgi:hypothetical protein
MSEKISLEVPYDLQAHAVWCTDASSGAVPEVVFVTERRWRRIAFALGTVGIFFSLTCVLLAHGEFMPYLAVAIACTGAAMACLRAGRAGFYQVNADGHLGRFLGRRAPDLHGLRRHRPATTTRAKWGWL